MQSVKRLKLDDKNASGGVERKERNLWNVFFILAFDPFKF